MQFTLRHRLRRGFTATYGFDPFLGFFVDVRGHGGCVGTYDALTEGYDRDRPLLGALYFLAGAGFFTADELEGALARAATELPEEMPRRLRAVANVVANFKTAAD